MFSSINVHELNYFLQHVFECIGRKKKGHHLKGALGFRIPTLYRPLDTGKAFEF